VLRERVRIRISGLFLKVTSGSG